MAKRSVATGILLLVGPALLLTACAGRAWDRARHQDTAAAYADFLREHPGSRYAQEALERSSLVRLRANPTPEAYQEFQEKYPESALLAELRAAVEERFFLRARAAGTPEAYRAYLEEFGAGAYEARARGNRVYLEAGGFDGQPAELARFAAEHPESDFAAEARRSADALEVRSQTGFRRVGLQIRIDPGTPGAERLQRVFAQRAAEAYAAMGLELVSVADGPAAPGVRLSISHAEAPVRTELATSQTPGIRATTRLLLERTGAEAPIWSEEFHFHTVGAVREDASVLFGPGSQPYWSSFFVPATRWSSQLAVRAPRELVKPVVAVDANATHAFVLFGDGDFQVYELGDPELPMLAGEYRRPRDLARWTDLRVFGDEVVLFGEDGVEVVQLGAEGPRRVRVWERNQTGTVVALERVPGGLVTAGKRGLLFLSAATGEVERLLDREILGLDRVGDRLVLSDGTSLYVSTLPLLRQQRVEGELRLGSGFGPGRIRVRGRTAVVLGERGLVRVSLAAPAEPRLLSRIENSEVGTVRDATLVRGRLFLLGDRGLQVADVHGERVADAAPVTARARLDAVGRHLVVVGEKTLQLVDTTPFLLEAGSAAPAALEPYAAWPSEAP